MVKSDKRTFHISWFSNVKKMDLRDPRQKKEWFQIILRRGTSKDLRNLNIQELKSSLPQLYLPSEIKNLWLSYFQNHFK